MEYKQNPLLKELLNDIPLLNQMGICDFHATQNSAVITAHLTPNLNHKNTVFGGSQFSLCAVTCYALMRHLFIKENIPTKNIVITESHSKFLKSATGDFSIKTHWPEEMNPHKFLETLRAYQKLSFKMKAQVTCGDIICTEWEGNFFVKL